MSTPANIKLKADVGRLIDGEAWKAMEDGRASLEGSLWHLRQGWALEKAEKIIALVLSDAGTKRTLEHWRQEVGKLHSQIEANKAAIAAKDARISELEAALKEIIRREDKAWNPVRVFRSGEEEARDDAVHEAWIEAADIARAALNTEVK